MVFHQGNTVQQAQSDAQSDSWNLNQEVPGDHTNNSNSPVAVNGTPPMAVFSGSADNMIEENQDWWLQDQSALALGLENWGEGWAGNQFVSAGGGEMGLQQQIPQVPNMQFRTIHGGNKPQYGYSTNVHPGY